MIETRQGLDNLDQILSVDGLEAIYIGPSDLSLALGCTPTFDDLDPPAAEAVVGRGEMHPPLQWRPLARDARHPSAADAELEPEIAGKALDRDFLVRYFKPDVAAKCGQVG